MDRNNLSVGSFRRNWRRVVCSGIALVYSAMGAAAISEAQGRAHIRVKLVSVSDSAELIATHRDIARSALARLREVNAAPVFVRDWQFNDALGDNALARSVARTYSWRSYAEGLAGDVRPGRSELTLYMLPPMIGSQPRPYLGGIARRVCSVGTRTALAFASIVPRQRDKSELVTLHEVLHVLGAYHALTPSVMSLDAFSHVTDGNTGSFERLPIANESRQQVRRCIQNQRNRGVLR